jgi:4-hydroxy-tetrahydrodipicolinate synthase
MMKRLFTGTGVALVTPFHKYGTVDFNSLGKIIEHTLSGKVDYLVVLGTTGETATMSKDERNAVCGFVLEVVEDRVPVVIGIGGNNTQEVVETINGFDFNGIEGILSVTPYYNRPQQKGLYYHYKSIANVSPLPLILYNVPGRTGVNMTAETTLRLANEFSNIVAVKEASGNLVQIMKILKGRPDHFSVISGDDALTLPMMAIGADGAISVVANAFPAEFSAMVKLALSGKIVEARKNHYLLLDFIEAIFDDGSPSGIKAALEILGLSPNNLRLPLVKVNKSVLIQLQALIEEIKK